MSPFGEIARRIDHCRACGSDRLQLVLDLGNPCLSDFIRKDDPDPPRVPLILMYCKDCELAQLQHTTNPDRLYRKFWYRSGTNKTMRDEMGRLVRVARHFGKGAPGEVWVDIGANDGTLLAQAPSGVRRIAFEPALNLADECKQHCDLLVSNYFFAGGIAEQADVIFSAAMFYDLDNPGAFLIDIARTLKPDGYWINQLSSTRHMIEANAFDNICHEHLTYYTVRTLDRLYRRHGLMIVSVSFNDTNGGSMEVVARRDDGTGFMSQSLQDALYFEKDMGPWTYEAFAKKVTAWRFSAIGRLGELMSQGKRMHVYGASTKGNTLLQFLGADHRTFEAASDRSSWKTGLVTAGSRIPILSEGDSRDLQPDLYFVLPWAFRREFVEREREFLANGGQFIFPLPTWQEVGA